tara:strand:+ start:234 stop:797 length:564 start_codon:yes stop_codon:yes gene_type:complete
MALSKIDVANMLTGAVPVANGGTALTSGFANGVTMIDQFRLTGNLDANADPISSDLERVDDASFSQIGTGMTLSSGVYTFPATGLYKIDVDAMFQIKNDPNADLGTFVSSNSGGAYDQTAIARAGRASNNDFINFGTSSTCMVNVTNATNFRVKFTLSDVASDDTRLQSGTNENKTTFTFIRLGDSQ